MSIEKIFDIIWSVDLIVTIILKTVIIIALNFWLIIKWRKM